MSVPIVTYITAILCVLNYVRIHKEASQFGIQEAVMRYGAVYRPQIEEKKEYWRLITGGFVHFSIWHLILNVYILLELGSSMEMMFGTIPYAILLFGSIITGNIFAVYMSNDYSISGGLSTGMFGLLAAELTIYYVNFGLQAILHDPGIMSTIILNVILNFMPGVGWKAHLGGICFGILFITAIFYQ